MADYIDLVANGIITNEETIAADPALVAGFVRATLRGLDYTLNNPAAAYEISKKFVEGLDDSRVAVLDASLPLWAADTLGLTERRLLGADAGRAAEHRLPGRAARRPGGSLRQYLCDRQSAPGVGLRTASRFVAALLPRGSER